MKETSVIIVHLFTDKRFKMLLKSLESLSNQTYKGFELVLVVDNIDSFPENITDALKSVDVKSNFSMARRGAAWCRKIGVEMSSGEYVAYLDDDAIAHPNWLLELIFKMKSKNLIGVGGKTLSSSIITRTQFFYDLNNSQRLPLVDKDNSIFNISTVNACFKRDALLQTKVIHENYILFAKQNLFFWFEDYDITYRLGKKFGYDKLGIAEEAIVYHNHRERFIEGYNQFKGYGKGAAFWLWCYNKRPSQLRGGQQLPKKINSIFGHLIELIKSLPYFVGLFGKARKRKVGIVNSFIYSLHSFGLRVGFHFGTYNGKKLILKQKQTK
ncbi:MAG: glycosyltransferase family 2 protein [Flavobacteriaceae bacterium]|nr:glycosyltransferase family 2 protein [Flavobacteriaceae bacterium]